MMSLMHLSQGCDKDTNRQRAQFYFLGASIVCLQQVDAEKRKILQMFHEIQYVNVMQRSRHRVRFRQVQISWACYQLVEPELSSSMLLFILTISSDCLFALASQVYPRTRLSLSPRLPLRVILPRRDCLFLGQAAWGLECTIGETRAICAGKQQ